MSASNWTPIVMAIGAGVCWGIGEVTTKLVLKSGQVGPISAVAVRTLVALPLVWGAWLLLARQGFAAGPLSLSAEPAWTRADGSTLIKLVLGAGVCAGAVALILFYGSLKLADVSVVKPIAFTIAPATAVLLGWLVLGEAMSVRKLLAVALILGGVALLASTPAQEARGDIQPAPVPPRAG